MAVTTTPATYRTAPHRSTRPAATTDRVAQWCALHPDADPRDVLAAVVKAEASRAGPAPAPHPRPAPSPAPAAAALPIGPPTGEDARDPVLPGIDMDVLHQLHAEATAAAIDMPEVPVKSPVADDPGQLELAIQHAPAVLREHGYRDAHSWPLVSPVVAKGEPWQSFRVPAKEAWAFPLVELRAGNSWPMMTLDCDGPESVDKLMAAVTGAGLKEPNVVTRRNESGNCHAHFMLGTPVHRNEQSRMKPQARLARIVEYFQAALLADPSYQGVLTLNPVWPGDEFKTWYLRPAPYELDELAEVIPDGWRRPRIAQTAVGRNVDVFGWAVREAHRPRAAHIIAAHGDKDCPEWRAIVNRHNLATYGTQALPYDEVVSVARSSAGYSLRQYSAGRFAEIQAARGHRSGKSRRQTHEERDQAIIADRAAGHTLRAIGDRHGVGKSTAARVCARLSREP